MVVTSIVQEVVGAMVVVLERAPEHPFVLPNGRLADGGRDGWVIEFQRPVKGLLSNGLSIETKFGVSADRNLRPIRDPGDDAQDETLQWLPVPSTEKEAA